MNYKIIPVDKFKKEAKRLVKKYPLLKSELTELSYVLSQTPNIGTPLGSEAYKIRMAIKSKGKEKSGGARIITYVVAPDKEVYLLTIYDKAEFDTVDDQTLRRIIDNLKFEK